MDIMDRHQSQKSKKKFLDYLKDEGGGNILFTCKKLGKSRSAIYLWREKDKKFNNDCKDAVEEGKETLADEAEASLRSSVKKGDPRTIIFALKNLRPSQWRDSQVIEHGGKVEIEDKNTSKELKKAVKEVYEKFRKDIRKPNTKGSKKNKTLGMGNRQRKNAKG